MNIPIVNPDMAAKAIVEAHKLRMPVMLSGPPGVAKTAAVRAAAAAIGGIAREVYLSRMTPADVGGLPALDHDTKRTTFYAPDLLTSLPTNVPGILFFEELTTADPQTRAAAMNFLLEGRLGDYELPPGWSCVAAGNPKEYGGIYDDLGAALNNRLIHLQIDGQDVDAWITWAMTNAVAPSVIAFIRTQPHSLMANPKEFDQSPKAFPSPRSWERVSRIVQGVAESAVRRAMIAGTLGEDVAARYQIYLEMAAALRPISEILSVPNAHLRRVLPDTVEGFYTLVYALGASLNEKSMNAVTRVLLAFTQVGKGKRLQGIPLADIQVLGFEVVTAAAEAKNLPIEDDPYWRTYNDTRNAELVA